MYEHVLQREEDGILKKALNLKVRRRNSNRPKATKKKRVEALMREIGLRKDVTNRNKWRLGVRTANENAMNPATSVDVNNNR